MKFGGRNALITGASAGIGQEFARQLAGRAQSLILVARREQRLNELRDELTQQHPNLRIRVRETDLGDLPQIEKLTASLERERIDVDLLINNAGLGDRGSRPRGRCRIRDVARVGCWPTRFDTGPGHARIDSHAARRKRVRKWPR